MYRYVRALDNVRDLRRIAGPWERATSFLTPGSSVFVHKRRALGSRTCSKMARARQDEIMVFRVIFATFERFVRLYFSFVYISRLLTT